MPRKVTVTLADGRQVTYANVPYSVTPQAMAQRVQTDYSQRATAIDGGGQPAANTADFYENRWSHIPAPQAKALVQRYTAAGVNANDPRMAGLMRVAGMSSAPAPAAAPAKRPSVAKAASDLANSEGGGDYGTALAAGIRRGLFGIPERLAAAGERFLPSAITGNTTNASYDNILQLIRARTDAEMARAPITGQVGAIAGNVAAGAGAGGALKAAGTKLLASSGTVANAAGNVLSKLTTMATPTVGKGLTVAQKAANAARIITAGAAGGGAQAAGEGGDVEHGAAAGAVGAGIVGGAGKLLSVAAQPVKAILGLSTAPQILSKFTSVTSDAMDAAAQRYRQVTGTEPTLFELLPPADRNALMKGVVAGKDAVVDQATRAIRARAASLGPDMAARVANVVQPQRAAIRDTIAGDLARARGVDPANLAADDHAVIDRAMSSPVDMEALRHTEAEAHVAPHSATPIVNNLRDLYPQAPNPTGDGPPVDLDPEVRSMISGAAGRLGRRADDAGINVGDINGMMQRIRGALGEGNSFTEQQTAQRALDHLHSVVAEANPEAATALQNSTDAYAARSRMIEGMREGATTRLRDDVQVGTNSGQARTVRNAYDTPEGQSGLVLGQSNALTSDLGGGPADALKATLGISRGRTSREMTQNLGQDASDQIGAAALAQDESAQALSSAASKAQGAGQGGTGAAMVNAIIGLHPGGFLTTKAHALTKLAHMTVVPENQARAITEMLFSQDPGLRGRAVQALANVPGGQDFLQSISGVAGTAAGGAASAPAVDSPEAPAAVPGPGDEPLPAAGGASGEPATAPGDAPLPAAASAGAVDPASSPYLNHLQDVYQAENPALLDLSDRIQHQESGGHQHNEDGSTKISKAGAIGTMQIMPGTAGDAAKAAGLPLDMDALHHDAIYNKSLGIAHLGSLLKHYGGDPVKAVAAYNAGAGTVDKALASGGNWIARLPAETQDYVAKVAG